MRYNISPYTMTTEVAMPKTGNGSLDPQEVNLGVLTVF